MNLMQKVVAELFGTFWLVFGGCGSAVFAAKFLDSTGANTFLGIGFVGVALAFGLTVMTMAYAIGHVSGCHLNPAVSLGLCVARRFPITDLIPYWIAQVAGALGGAYALQFIASGNGTFAIDASKAGAFATNGFDAFSPGGYSMTSCFVAEALLTFFFLFIILGATDRRAPAGFAPIAIGLGLTLIHLIGIPITNLSVNPARSTGPAILLGLESAQVHQLWLFWAAPLMGAAFAGVAYPLICEPQKSEV
ncbi:MAG: aquaporin Z [Gemmataceae bacterium]